MKYIAVFMFIRLCIIVLCDYDDSIDYLNFPGIIISYPDSEEKNESRLCVPTYVLRKGLTNVMDTNMYNPSKTDASVLSCETKRGLTNEACRVLEGKLRDRREYSRWNSSYIAKLSEFLLHRVNNISSTTISDRVANVISRNVSTMLEVAERYDDWDFYGVENDIKISRSLLANAFSYVTINLTQTNVTLSSALWTDFVQYNDIVNVELAKNNLSIIRNDDFVGLEDSVVFLMLHSNNIEHVEEGAFESLKRLCFLDLKLNKLHDVKDNIFLSSTLRGLDLSYNFVRHVTPSAFSSLESLVALDLNGNNLYEMCESSDWLGGVQFLQTYTNKNTQGWLQYQLIATQLSLGCNRLSLCESTPYLPTNTEYLNLSVSEFKEMPTFTSKVAKTLIVLSLSMNDIKTIPKGYFDHFESLILLDISKNEISEMVEGTFDGLENTLVILMLNSNPIKNWRANVFGKGFKDLEYLGVSLNNYRCDYIYFNESHHVGPDETRYFNDTRPSYKFCAYEYRWHNLTNEDLTYQENYYMNVESYGFTGLLHEDASVILAYTNIPSLPAYMFSGSNMKTLSFPLGHFDSIDDFAFSGDVKFESISLEKATFSSLSPMAFHGLSFNDTTCVDLPNFAVGWTDDIYACVDPAGNATCYKSTVTCESLAAVADAGSLLILALLENEHGLRAVDACCVMGGGKTYGLGVMMDASASPYCAPAAALGGEVECSCPITQGKRYDLSQRQCIDTCNSGEFWENVTSSREVHRIRSDTLAGRCAPCKLGEHSILKGFTNSCDKCRAGKYAEINGSTLCEPCDIHSYSIEGASTCETCPYGKYTNSIASAECEPCPWSFVGSRRCTVPVMAIVVTLFCIVFIVVTGIFLHRRWKKQHDRLRQLQNLLQASAEDLELMSSAWQIDWDDIDLEKELAHGSFGSVWLGNLNSKWEVAVKRVYDTKAKKFADDAEIRFLLKARHPRLVLFLGCGFEKDNGNLFIVLEFCEKGALNDVLWQRKDSSSQSQLMNPDKDVVSWSTRLQIMCDVAEAMSYLHLIHNSIHRDLKSPNILLVERKERIRAKVADFGLTKILARDSRYLQEDVSPKKKKKKGFASKIMNAVVGSPRNSSIGGCKEEEEEEEEEEKTSSWSSSSTSSQSNKNLSNVDMTGDVGTPQWMAPEICAAIGKSDVVQYDVSIDTYAFGIIMWECLALSPPWSEKKYNFSCNIFDAVEAGERPIIRVEDHKSSPFGFATLMKRCWAQDSKSRPPFNSIEMELKDMMTAHFKKVQALEVRAATSSSVDLPLQSHETGFLNYLGDMLFHDDSSDGIATRKQELSSASIDDSSSKLSEPLLGGSNDDYNAL